MRITRSVVSIIALISYGGNAQAGRMHTLLGTFPDQSIAVHITVDADGIGKADLDKAGIWVFSFEDNSYPSIRITLNSSGLPEGFSSPAVSFDIPYYWDDNSHSIAVAAVKEDLSGLSIPPFLSDMVTKSTSVDSLVAAHSRATLFFAERLRQLREREHVQPNAEDISIAYWVLSTTRDLEQRYYYVPDVISQKALSWIDNLLWTQSNNSRLFNSHTAAAQDFAKLSKMLKARISFFYKDMIQHLNDDFKVRPSKTCSRIGELDIYFSNLDGDALSEANGEWDNRLQIKNANVVCKALEIKNSLPDSSANLIEDGKKAAKEASKIIDNSTKKSTGNRLSAAARSLKARISELNALVDAY